MAFVTLNDVTLHYRFRPGDSVPIVFLNSLGTDFRIWDDVIADISGDAPVLCLDKRGHGLSDVGPIDMDLLVSDVAALMDYLGMRGALICGVSVGGMIAQGLGIARPDLVAGLVLCCTGPKIGDADSWNARIAAVETNGIASLSESILTRWFSAGFLSLRKTDVRGYRNMLTRTTVAGYAGVCAAIRDADLAGRTARLSVPTQCLAGADDLATSPALVEQLAGLIAGATYVCLENCGHLPSIEQPVAVARVVRDLHQSLV